MTQQVAAADALGSAEQQHQLKLAALQKQYEKAKKQQEADFAAAIRVVESDAVKQRQAYDELIRSLQQQHQTSLDQEQHAYAKQIAAF